MFRSLYERVYWRAHASISRARLRMALAFMPRIAGADGDPPPPPANQPPAAQPQGTPPADPAPKQFSQADVDRIVQDRLQRDRKERPSDEEIASLREKAGKFDEVEAANQSDLEKVTGERDQFKQERDDAISRGNQMLRKAAIVTAAAEAGVDSEIVFALLAQADFKVTQGENNFEVTVDDSGAVAGANEAVKALIELKNFAGATPTPPGPGDGGSRQPAQPKDLDEQIREAEAAGDTATAMSLKNRKLAASLTS